MKAAAWFARVWGLVGAVAAWACVVPAATAQTFEFEADSSSATIACLAPAVADLPKPVYPPDELTMRAGGFVRVRLEFSRPDRAPGITTIFRSAPAFEAVVLERVKQYRLPCLKADAKPLVVYQEFSFDPRDGRNVFWSEPSAEVPASTNNRCVIHGRGTSDVRYPSFVPSNAKDATVLARLTFTATNQPPKVEILNKVKYRAFELELIDYVKKTWVTCDSPDVTWPVTALQTFSFHMEGADRVALKDMTLKSFVSAVQDLDKQQVRFDLSSMACPFEVQLSLYQPFATNSVGEVGASNPNRAAFLAWLRSVALRIPDETLNQVLGDSIRISVPCGVLDLTS
jgi:hypothetical protein